jgi:hypothetical protein
MVAGEEADAAAHQETEEAAHAHQGAAAVGRVHGQEAAGNTN